MKIITRETAKERGLKFYFTGNPCKRGHIAKRYVSSYICIECDKDYREENKEIKKEYDKQRYEENKEEMNKKRRKKYEENPSKERARQKEYYEENREELVEYQKKYRENNPEKAKESSRKSCKKHYKENKGYYAAKCAKRIAQRLQATPTWADMEKVFFFYECCPAGCHVDHIIPLNHPLVCGLHNEFNLQWLPAEENLSKGNKFDPETFKG